MSEFEMYTPPLYQSPFSPIPDDLSFNFSMPLTPSDFGSADETQIYSPRTSAAIPMSHAAPEKTHATSGVSSPSTDIFFAYANIPPSEGELRTVPLSAHSENAKKSTPEILKSNSQNSQTNIKVSRHLMQSSRPLTRSCKRHYNF